MAQPTNPLIVWANQDVILPNAQRPNKKLPQTSLIETGYDLSQKPAADEWNYVLNNYGQYIKYLAEEKINEFLKKSENLNDLVDKAVSRTNLDVFSKLEVNSKTISAGVGLSGGGDLSSNRIISMATPSTVGLGSVNSATNGGSPTHTHALDITSNIAILTGTVVSGGTIPLPAGYSESQCKWMVSINTAYNDGDPNLDVFQCTLSGRTVTVRVDGNSSTSQIANYIIIGAK
ncbi:hypothetical protein BNCALIDO_00033 [Aeromonas phage vB_AdhM_TS9]|nr:hypothetical protein BNCALIDO_00033 [Aeromonas phage vB_AdhM_TS9]